MPGMTAGYLTRADSWETSYFDRLGLTPECGDPSCRDDDCALRDRNGYDYDGYDSEGFDREGYDENGEDRRGNTRCTNGECDCYECERRDYDERLNGYSYRPMLRFNGDKAPYYGMEIEITTDNVSSMLDVVESHAPRLIYAKEDSSVDGAELVTHPMSYPWAMEHFPWEMLPEIRATGATVVGQENGIHVHVGRDGFDGSAHLYRWMKFWYRNPSDIQRIARRRAGGWAGFSPDHRAGQVEHVKYGKPGYRFGRDSTRGERYAAINTTNEATLEVRVFASTLRPQRAQAALQLVAGTVEYARELSADAITHRHGWDWKAFMSWAGKSGDYSALLAENRLRYYR